jgi:hypothetical protein
MIGRNIIVLIQLVYDTSCRRDFSQRNLLLGSNTIFFNWTRLVGSAGDEEPLVDAGVNWCRGQLLVLGDVGQLLGGDAAGGVLDGNVGAVCVSLCIEY